MVDVSIGMLLVSAGNVCCIVLMFVFSLFLLIIISVASMWHVPPLFSDDLFCFVVSFFFFSITFFLMTFFLCLGLHCYCSSAIPDEANSQCHAMPFDSFNPHPQHCLMDLRLAVLLMCELMASWCRLNDGLVGSKSYWMFFEPRVFLPKEPVKNPNGSIFYVFDISFTI